MNLDRPLAPDPYEILPQFPLLDVTSDDFSDRGELGDAHAFAEGNHSPALAWSGAPQGTRSFAVSCFDPDAPTPAGFWHWFVVGLGAGVQGIARRRRRRRGSRRRAFTAQRLRLGRLRRRRSPPGDRPHRYYFAVHALDVPPEGLSDLGIDADTSPTKASFLLLGQTLARGSISATYAIDE